MADTVCCYKPLGHGHKVKSFVVHSSETIKLESEHEKSAREREKQSFCSELCLELIDPQDNNTRAFKSAIHHHFLIIYIFLNFV